MRRIIGQSSHVHVAVPLTLTSVACLLVAIVAPAARSCEPWSATFGEGAELRTLDDHLPEPHKPTNYQAAPVAPARTPWRPAVPQPNWASVIRSATGLAQPPAVNGSQLRIVGESSGSAPTTSQTSIGGKPDAMTYSPATPATPARTFPQPSLERATPPAGSAGEQMALRDKIRRVLAMYYPRHQNTRDNNPWEVIHAIVAYGVDQQLFKGGPGGEKVNAIGWLCYNYPCAGYQMFTLNRDKIEGRRGVGVQGHAGQFLAYISQSHLKSDYPMLVGGKSFTIADLIEREKETCVAGEELTFKLIALANYLDSDATWITPDGQEWSISRLVHEELKQPIRGAACGGAHRLMGYSTAYVKRQQRGKPITGEFARAQDFVQNFHRYTFSLQNPDGSFSTEFFVRRGDSPDLNARLNSTGHILEWMAYSVPEDQLLDPRIVKAADYLANLLLNNDRMVWSIGPLGHGLHGLAIYNSRAFKDSDFSASQMLVEGVQPEPREARRSGQAEW